MPPRRSNNNKKKVKRRDRNEKSFTCQGCSKHLDKNNFIYCVCTQVRYCSDSCQHDHPHNNCSGPPETSFNMDEMLQRIPNLERLSSRPTTVGARQMQEQKDTVQEPSLEYMLRRGAQFLMTGDISAWDYAALADEGDELGNQACAYLAGSRFRHRILSTPRLNGTSLSGRNRGSDNIPVLESQELAFKYFEKAAKLGHGLAMQSLATCFDDGIGCRSNRRRSKQWLWRACLQNSAGAIELFTDRALIPLEINANGQMLDQALHHLKPGQGLCLGGPNLAALLVAFNDVIQKENYSLPPFADTWATGTVNNSQIPTCDNRPRTPLIGAEAVKDLLAKTQFLTRRGNEIQFGYCRRGAAKQATAQTHGAATRLVDNQLFFAPRFAACDERVSGGMLQEWHQQCKQLFYNGENGVVHSIVCPHNETKERKGLCEECEEDAIERLDAISKGSVVLSISEDISQRGHAAIFRGKNGSLKMETWKAYAGGEAECVLAVLAASGLSAYVTPLFVAQDPNFLWPLIADHGCIRAALEFVAPHVNWTARVGVAKENIQQQVPVIPSCKPGRYLRKCGNSFCTKLEDYKAMTFELCSKCRRRQYCSAHCQRSDYTLHKHECGVSANEGETNPRLDDPDCEDMPKELKYNLNLEQGQDCVVHGLQAKPHYNGTVGIVGETTEDGRMAVTLRSDTKPVLSVKPKNLYSIGVFCRKRKKKSRVFECVHGLERCADCYLDFTTVNRLTKLKYEGQDMTSVAAIDQVNDTYFSSFSFEDDEGTSMNKDWPIECQGMGHHSKQRLILKALLQVKATMSLNAEVAKTAHITYGAATVPILRAVTRLAEVAKIL